MEARPTTSMKKGWLCRTSCDDKNHEIAPVMMIQQWWSRSRDDPNLVMMPQKWSRSSDDDPDQVMIQIQMKMTWRWRWLEDEYDLKMKITWSWRWRGIEDDPDDTKKNTCADKLCRENTFLVKMECWCNCNFRMYSLVYFIHCISLVLDVPIRTIINVIKSCKVIEVNPSFLSRGKFPTVVGH